MNIKENLPTFFFSAPEFRLRFSLQRQLHGVNVKKKYIFDVANLFGMHYIFMQVHICRTFSEMVKPICSNSLMTTKFHCWIILIKQQNIYGSDWIRLNRFKFLFFSLFKLNSMCLCNWSLICTEKSAMFFTISSMKN